MAESLLVNYWYANPVGHAVEALRLCLGYHRARPDLAISVVLNATTATELASFCPFVKTAYPVDFGFFEDDRDPARALVPVPRDWDYVVDDPRAGSAEHLVAYQSFRRFYEASSRHFRARRHHGPAGGTPPPYEPNHQLRFELPEDARERARAELGSARIRIALMPAGSGRRADYPSPTSWVTIVKALRKTYRRDVRFCLVGKLAAEGRTTTSIDRKGHKRIARACRSAVDYFDRPLVDQLAAVEACQLFLSPHTGFGMAAVAVGTPWLTISGGPWHEYFFNGVPFYSLLPDPDRYPCFTQYEPLPTVAEDKDKEGERALSMSSRRIREDLPELVDAARLLLDGCLPYEQALRLYFPRLLTVYAGNRTRISSFDDLHEQYV